MLSSGAVREIILSRKVGFGRGIDPDDEQALEGIHNEVVKRARVTKLSPTRIAVSFRSTSHERSVALVNELVRKLTGEDRREAEEKARADLKYYRDRLAQARTNLAEIDKGVALFGQAALCRGRSPCLPQP